MALNNFVQEVPPKSDYQLAFYMVANGFPIMLATILNLMMSYIQLDDFLYIVCERKSVVGIFRSRKIKLGADKWNEGERKLFREIIRWSRFIAKLIFQVGSETLSCSLCGGDNISGLLATTRICRREKLLKPFQRPFYVCLVCRGF